MAHNPHPLAPLTPGLCTPVVYLGDVKKAHQMLRARLTIDKPETVPACVIVVHVPDEDGTDNFYVTALAPWYSE